MPTDLVSTVATDSEEKRAKEKAQDEAEEREFFYMDPFRKLVGTMRQKGIKWAFEEMGFSKEELTAPENYRHLMWSSASC